MIDDMRLRKLSPKTQAAYLRSVLRFTRFFGRSPDLASPEDLRAFQLQLVEEGVSSTTLNATLTGLGFFFGVSLERPSALKRMSRVRQPQKLPQVLSVEEEARLLAGSSNPKHRAALAVAYGAGLRASEVVHLKITDIDSERMIVRVVQGKGQRDRYAMLSPSLLELLRAQRRHRYKTMTLATPEFIRRFLIHVLPSGFHRIRHYGLFANPVRAIQLTRVRQLLANHTTQSDAPATQTADDQPPASTYTCPTCGAPMIIIETFARPNPRAPPIFS